MALNEIIQFGIAIMMVAGLVATSLFVYVDAEMIGMRKDPQLGEKLLNNSPLEWFVGCMFAVVVALPLYLVARHEHVRKLMR